MKSFLSESVFWKCQFLLADAQRAEAEAKLSVARALERYHAGLRQAGLDPSVPYRWDARDFTVHTPDTPS